jgi:hypothetical protein
MGGEPRNRRLSLSKSIAAAHASSSATGPSSGMGSAQYLSRFP